MCNGISCIEIQKKFESKILELESYINLWINISEKDLRVFSEKIKKLSLVKNKNSDQSQLLKSYLNAYIFLKSMLKPYCINEAKELLDRLQNLNASDIPARYRIEKYNSLVFDMIVCINEMDMFIESCNLKSSESCKENQVLNKIEEVNTAINFLKTA